MSAAPTNSKHHRYASLALLAGAVSILALGLFVPVATSILEAREAIASEAERLDGLREKRVDLAVLEGSLRSTKAKAAQQALYLDAVSSAAAWERLQAAAEELSSAHQASMRVGRMLRQEDDSGLKAIRGEFVIEAPRAKLSQLILAIERRTPLLLIEKLQLEPTRGGDDRIQVTAAIRILAAIGQSKTPR